jgi:hypothetical protein
MSNVIAIVAIHDSLESLSNDVELVAQKAQKFEHARHIVDTLVTSKGGRVIGQVQGNEIVELPIDAAEVLREIHERLQEEVGIKAAIGVGEDSQQAAEAVAFAKENAPGSIKVYSPEMTEESSESVKEPEVAVGPDDVMAKSEQPYQSVSPEDKEKIGQTLAMIQQNKPLFDQIREQSPEVYASIVGVVQTLTQIIQYDKVAKEQAVVQMLEEINEHVRKEKAKKVKGHAKEINSHIKRHMKSQSKEQLEAEAGLGDNAQKMHSLKRKNARDFAKENGHDDPEFLLKLLNAFRK